MRKFLCLVLLCPLLAALCGCSSSPTAAPEQGAASRPVLRVVHYLDPDGQEPYDLYMYELFRRYTQQTGVEVEVVTRPWDQLDETLVLSSQSREPLGDLFILSLQKLEYMVNSNALLPLDEYLDASFEREEFLTLALDAGTSAFDGRVYLMAQSLHTRGLWYNRQYVDQPPETFAEVEALSKEIMEQHEGVYGVGFWGGSHYGAIEGTLCMLTWANGGQLSEADGRAAWSTQAVANGIRMMHDWVRQDGIAPEICLTTADATDVQEMFYNGELAMIFDGSFAYSRNEFSFSDAEKFGFAPMPGVDGPSENFSNGWGWGIPVNSQQPELAWDFIAWFQAKGVQMEHAMTEGALPTRVDALEDPALAQHGYMPSFIPNLLEYGRPMDTFVYYSEAMDALTAVSNGFCLEPDIDLEAALEEAQALFNQKYYS